MSVEYINRTINELQLSGLQIFYDFNSYSGSNVIRSVESGNASYSGEIVNFNTAFTGTSSGSGFFDGQYINIKNTENITSADFTIIFSQEKTGATPGVVFSDIDEGGPSGCEIGITAANKLYYKNYIAGTPSYKTLNDYLFDKNICSVRVSDKGAVNISRLDIGEKREESFIYRFDNPTNSNPDAPDGVGANLEEYALAQRSDIVPTYTVSNGTSWKIGSGEYPYKGYMDYFLYFDVDIGEYGTSEIIKSIYSSYETVGAQTGLISGAITGYAAIPTEVSGIVGTPSYVSGTGTQSGFYTYTSGEAVTGAVGISGVVYVPQTGIEHITGSDQVAQTIYKTVKNLSLSFSLSGTPQALGLPNYESSGSYWHFSGRSGTFNGASATGAPGTLFGVTGFRSVNITGYLTGQSFPLLGTSGTSGVLYTGFSYSGLRAPNVTYTGSGAYESGSSSGIEGYYANSISAIGAIDENYFYDVVYDIGTPRAINNNTTPITNSTYGIQTFYMTGLGNSHQTNVAINGVSTFTGSIELATNQFNFPTATVTSGFFPSGVEVFTELELSLSDRLIYDIIASGNRGSLTIPALTDYSSSPFAGFDIADKTVFFNGVKLYSGIDYVYDGGFAPTGNVTGATGVYFTYLNYAEQLYKTGSGESLVTVDDTSIKPKGYTLFFNGIREPISSIIEHARYSDLISGTPVVNGSAIIYNATYTEGENT